MDIVRDVIELTRFDGTKTSIQAWEIFAIAEAQKVGGPGNLNYNSDVFTRGFRHFVMETYDEIKTALGWEPKKVESVPPDPLEGPTAE